MNSKTILYGGIAAGIIIVMVGLVAANSLSQPETQSEVTFDPIGNPTAGDLLIISGTTSFPPGTQLLIRIAEDVDRPDDGSKGPEPTNAGMSVKVFGSTGGPNKWSAPVDTSILRPDTYRVEAKVMNSDHKTGNITFGNISGTTGFVLGGEYMGADEPVATAHTENAFIRVDPVGESHVGDQFLVTGTTNLPVGTDVIWEVFPAALTTDQDQTGEFSGMMSNSFVTRGTGETNRVTLALDTTLLLPGEYLINASTTRGDLMASNFMPGDVAGSIPFILK
ncbi:MAG: hypothetical protein LUQ25_07550 [Methanoregulaceae archaeon]|nr:hypothetical protein [Methanoregulaceae archaeon]